MNHSLLCCHNSFIIEALLKKCVNVEGLAGCVRVRAAPEIHCRRSYRMAQATNRSLGNQQTQEIANKGTWLLHSRSSLNVQDSMACLIVPKAPCIPTIRSQARQSAPHSPLR